MEAVQHNVLPERLKNHSMAQTRQYINYDTELGVDIYPDGFLIQTPAGTSFLSPSYFNVQHDPFIHIEKTTMEEGDILISSACKTGSHWMYEIVSMLTRGTAKFDKLSREAVWLDIQLLEKILNTVPKPRVLGTHMPPGWLPEKFRRPSTKVIMMIRNLKDVIVSAYNHHIQKKAKPYDQNYEFYKMCKQILHGRYAPFGNYFDVYADTWDKQREDPNILIVMYEELKRNPAEVIQKISDHLDVNTSPELISEIADAVHITKLKPGKYESEAMLRRKFGEHFTLFRRGQVGEWKSWFTVDMDEEFNRVINEWNKDRQIPFIYEI